jgi:hypothetical protein
VTRVRVLVAVSVWVLLSVGLWASDADPAVLLLGAVVAAVVVAIVVAIDLVTAGSGLEWTRPPTATLPVSADDPVVTSLRRQIHGASWGGSTMLRDTLLDAIDERLLAGRQIDRSNDPAAATAALTPRLRRFVERQRRREVAPGELRQILTDIEAL